MYHPQFLYRILQNNLNITLSILTEINLTDAPNFYAEGHFFIHTKCQKLPYYCCFDNSLAGICKKYAKNIDLYGGQSM